MLQETKVDLLLGVLRLGDNELTYLLSLLGIDIGCSMVSARCRSIATNSLVVGLKWYVRIRPCNARSTGMLARRTLLQMMTEPVKTQVSLVFDLMLVIRRSFRRSRG